MKPQSALQMMMVGLQEIYEHLIIYIYIIISEPFRVGFMEHTYIVDESVGAVHVCVNLTHPMRDILDNTLNVFVIDDSSSKYIPPDAPLASEFMQYIIHTQIIPILCFLSSSAPDEPNFLGQYPMVEGTDFAQQTMAVNVIDDNIISEERRIICYNQPIYDDVTPETDEYIGLSLGIISERTTVLTEVEPMYGQAAILILDNDSEFGSSTLIVAFIAHKYMTKLLLYSCRS